MLALTSKNKVTLYKGTALHVDRMASYCEKAAGRKVMGRMEHHPSCSRRSNNVQWEMGDPTPGFSLPLMLPTEHFRFRRNGGHFERF